jgi:hypothetical protein
LSVDPFAGLLDPFAHWDISESYTRYAAFFDLVIYCAIFIALAHAVFTRRFTGRPGKVMATAVGFALGISLAVAGRQFGFSLRDAGPVAILLMLILVGYLIFHTLLQVHADWKLAAPLTYVIIYLFMRAISPALFALIVEKVPFISLLSAVILLTCLWRIGAALWPKGMGSSHAEHSDASFVARLDRKEEEKEVKAEKWMARKSVPQATRETVRIERALEGIQKELRRDRPDWQTAARSLSDIAHRSDDVIHTLDKVRLLDRRLRNFDWQQLQHLSGYYGQLNDNEKGRLKEQILLERGKVIQEHAIEQLTERCERRQGDYRRSLDDAQKACARQDRDSVLRCIATALSIEAQQKQDLHNLQLAEARLLDLTRLKLRKE